MRNLRQTILIAAIGVLIPLLAVGQETNCLWTNVERVVAVGDVHGDFDRLVSLLRASGLVDKENRWIGGRAHLVQTGDVLDRGPQSRKAMDLLMKLERESRDAGGRVHALIGNHEAMVLRNDLRYVLPEEFEALGGEPQFRKAFSPAGDYGKWILGHNAVIRIDDVLFLHGGISPGFVSRSMREINDAIRTELAADKPEEQGVAGAPDGPLWYRGYADGTDSDLKTELASVFKAYRVRHIVVGHTVSKKGIRTRGDGELIMIDVGMSRTYYGGDAACLLIEGGKFFVVTPTGKTALPMPNEVAPTRVNTATP